ncbi:MAG: hypothetical protein ACLPT4_04335 [Verrucomicrobiia bacterium]
MKSRIITVVVCQFYVMVVMAFGIVHHHERIWDPTHRQDNCAACAWQLYAVSDVPNVAPVIFAPVLENPLQVFQAISHSSPTFSFSPSRAPPAALA